MWRAIKDWIEEYVLLTYKPDRHALPPRQTKKRTSGQTTDINLAGHSLVGGQLWAPDKDDDSETAHAAWRQDDVRTGFGQRQETLTEADMEELRTRKLNAQKAMSIKPYWAKGFTIPETSSLLSRVGNRKVKGYSERTVSDYFGAFTSALDRGEHV
ncbi:MAG: hypothetical protein H6573_34735 [Lewinellaceae bacterium]|nr:hypothetical protein [Lewinellaceae bacterium]